MVLCPGAGALAATPLDRTLQPEPSNEVSNVFRDMGVVQRRAMAKGGRFLFSTFGSMDFSDGPYTRYSVNFNPGYAISDFWEIYLNYVPSFIVNARPIVQKVTEFGAQIVAAMPQSQLGAELIWAPLYGKDSLAMHSVVRSDTFVKLGVSQITYDQGSGMRYVFGVGKTFFLSDFAGFRFCLNYGHIEDIIDGTKAFNNMALIEVGLVGYW